mmetsp:Transcript_10205/g.14982  ORF Transcript_10205/g.14982 Transcript_10205/m.14982 type:complete len:200 (-) Transcript_10205:1772-2371(-)
MDPDILPTIWSDEIRSKDFLAWLEDNHRTQMLLDTYQCARNNCIKLLSGKGVPKSPLTPRKRFCSAFPLNNLRLDWRKIEESAVNVANIYGGHLAAEGGLLWCVRRLRSFVDAENMVRLEGRKKFFYEFLCCAQREGSKVYILGEQQGIMRLVADFVGIRPPIACSDATCTCVFSSCQVPRLWKIKMQKNSKARPRKTY